MGRDLHTIWGLATVCVTVAALAGCGGSESGTVEVQLRLNACVAGGATCFALGLPEANISLIGPDGGVLASGKSGQAGKVVLTTKNTVGEARIVAISPLIEGGRRESAVVLPDPGKRTNITIGAGGIYLPAG